MSHAGYPWVLEACLIAWKHPNVYLELGVRWALRDTVTVLISQDIQEVRFNVSANRVIHYGPMPEELKEAQRQIAQRQ